MSKEKNKNCGNCRHRLLPARAVPCDTCSIEIAPPPNWRPKPSWGDKQEPKPFNFDEMRSTPQKILIRDEVDDFDPDDYERISKHSTVFMKSRQCGFAIFRAKYMEALIEQINKKEKNKMIKITIGTASKNEAGELVGVNNREIFQGITKIEVAAEYLKIHEKVDAKKLVYMEEVENWQEFTRI